jgi:hypothetical protein
MKKEPQDYFSFQIEEKVVTYSKVDMNMGNITETRYELDFNFFVPKIKEKGYVSLELRLSYHIHEDSASPRQFSWSIKDQDKNNQLYTPVTNFKNSNSILFNNYMVKMNKEYILPLLKNKITKNTIHANTGGQDIDYYHYNSYNQNLVKEFKEDFDILVGSIAARKPLDSSLDKTDFNALVQALDSHDKKRMFNKLHKNMAIKDEKPKVMKI